MIHGFSSGDSATTPLPLLPSCSGVSCMSLRAAAFLSLTGAALDDVSHVRGVMGSLLKDPDVRSCLFGE